MKFPKNRANVYVVLRQDGVPVGVFADLSDAEDYAGACEQQWYEKTGVRTRFNVTITTFYG